MRLILTAMSTGLLLASPVMACAQGLSPVYTTVSDVVPVGITRLLEAPNGRFLLARTDSAEVGVELRRFDRQTRRWVRFPDDGWAMHAPTLSRDGRFLAYARDMDPATPASIWVTPLDSATLLPVGAARRVSMLPGTAPAFSPDSRTIAFVRSDTLRSRIYLVPFGGGRERVLVDMPRTINEVGWSPDGRSVLFTYYGYGLFPRVARIPIAGGRIDSLLPRAGYLGFASDGRHLAQAPPALQPLVVIADGDGKVQGRFTTPRDISVKAWSGALPNRLLAVRTTVPTQIHEITVVGDTLRSLTSGRTFDSDPALSPDGARLAYESRQGNREQLLVADADGRHPRVLIDSMAARASLLWSPDGRYLAAAVIGPALISLIDVATGQRRSIEVGIEGRWRPVLSWRGDSRAVRFVRPGTTLTVWEFDVTGRSRLVRDLARVLPPPRNALTLVGDSLLVVSTTDSLVGIPLPAGASRTLYRGSVRAIPVSASHDHEWIVFSAAGPGQMETPRLVSLRTGETRSASYSLAWGVVDLAFHPDGRHLVISGYPIVHGRLEIILVSLAGDPPRVLTATDRTAVDFGPFSLSPDGRVVVYPADQTWETELVDVDLPRVIAVAPGRPVRR